jgi:membrane associated rhomboid family serine protease
MVQAPVGWQCRQCVRRNSRKSPVVRYRPGMPGRPSPRQAPVTMTLLVVNVVLFVAALSSARLTYDSLMVPAFMQNFGQPVRLFASFFVTNNLLDVALNMWCLYIIGRLVEPVLGPWRYIAVYLLAGLGGSVAYYLVGNPLVPAAGASGAIFGLFGAYFVLARRAAANTSGIIGLIAINLLFSFTVPDIAWQAHVGGLATGLVVAGGLSLARRGRPGEHLLVGTAVVLATTAALVLLLTLPPGAVNLG